MAKETGHILEILQSYSSPDSTTGMSPSEMLNKRIEQIEVPVLIKKAQGFTISKIKIATRRRKDKGSYERPC